MMTWDVRSAFRRPPVIRRPRVALPLTFALLVAAVLPGRAQDPANENPARDQLTPAADPGAPQAPPASSLPPRVRVAYLVPSNREPQPNAEQVLQRYILRLRAMFRENMARMGYEDRTFTIETIPGTGVPVVHVLRSPDPDTAFHIRDYVGLWSRILNGVQRSGIQPWEEDTVLLIVAEIHRQLPDGSFEEGTIFYGGTGTPSAGVAAVTGETLARMSPEFLVDDRPYGGLVIPGMGPHPLVTGATFALFDGTTVSSISSSGQGAAAHELAHGFALPHDFRSDANYNGNLLGNGLRGIRGFFHPERYPADDTRLSSASALLLSVSRFFMSTRDETDTTAPFARILSGRLTPVEGLVRVAVEASDTQSPLAGIVLLRNGAVVADRRLDGNVRSILTSLEVYDYIPGAADSWELMAYDVAGNRRISFPLTLAVEAGFPRAPHPHVRVSPRRITAGEVVSLDATASFDPDGNSAQLRVEWDLDGDGVFDTGVSSSLRQDVVFPEPGVYQITARVIDGDGHASTSVPVGIRVDPPNVNHLVTLEPTGAVAFTPDATGCPSGYAGTFTVETILKNLSPISIGHPAIEISTLTPGNLLLVGLELLEEREVFAARSQGTALVPDEAVVVPFTVCLQERQPFQLFVNVRGVH